MYQQTIVMKLYIEDLARQAEEAAEKGEQGKIYKITRQICGKFHSTNDVPKKRQKWKAIDNIRRAKSQMGRALQRST